MIIKGQDYRITATVGVSIVGAASVQIGYLKPAGTAAYWTAVVDDAPSGAIHFDVPAAQNDTVGTWSVWPKVVQGDGKVVLAAGKKVDVYAEGTTLTP